MNTFVIKFVLVGIAFSIVQVISGDLDFWYDNDDELYDIDKRQTWPDFKWKHVVKAATTEHNDTFWDLTARHRLGNKYGTLGRQKQTFIRVNKQSAIKNNFDSTQCAIPPKDFKGVPKGFEKSKDKFDIVQLVWNGGNGNYTVSYPARAHVCVRLEDGKPVHYEDTEA